MAEEMTRKFSALRESLPTSEPRSMLSLSKDVDLDWGRGGKLSRLRLSGRNISAIQWKVKQIMKRFPFHR